MIVSRLAMIFALLSPAGIALAQTLAAFDGTYASAPVVRSMGQCTVPQPGPLTIKNGAAQFSGGLNGDLVYQGTVNAQGSLVMRNNLGTVLSGKVDNRKATAGSANPGCSSLFTWQKQ
jgi:hypothetical protein